MRSVCLGLIILLLVALVLCCLQNKDKTVSKPIFQTNSPPLPIRTAEHKRLKEHLARISELSHKNGTYLFPRNGFLLGIVRHGGFLPNEEEVDADMACLYEDVPKIMTSDWEEYTPSLLTEFGNGWDENYNNGKHPLTDKEPDCYSVFLKHKYTDFVMEFDCIFPYKPGHHYYPWWSIKDFNSDKEFRLHSEKYGDTIKILGQDEQPISRLFTNPKYLGKVGTPFKSEDLAKFVPYAFYDTQLYIPQGSRNILKAEYGENVFTHVINKY
jgi:hypothetical protein